MKSKIEHIEKQMRSAFDWTRTETGAGLQEHDNFSWKESILRRCQYYFQLEDVFRDRASMIPPVTTDQQGWDKTTGTGNNLNQEGDEEDEDDGDALAEYFEGSGGKGGGSSSKNNRANSSEDGGSAAKRPRTRKNTKIPASLFW